MLFKVHASALLAGFFGKVIEEEFNCPPPILQWRCVFALLLRENIDQLNHQPIHRHG